ncbi:uncharacterized protein F5147DRAFT_779159 [Suillus discolor]|uniref:Uncharacterized protein n=1 Tax=Suillus discolor TaxID=1912936 RepID=A0A9P7EX24_9AGAM|nr:uncharacterized protein F5147DRAFT_779159 [Suillus discolor]KAG2093881.1 hypothetical protein F5147DRAFT_779159 [Suillus discolor]
MNRRGRRRQNTKIPQVEAAPEPVAPAPAALPPAAPTPIPVIPAAAATTTAAAAIATALHRPRRQQKLPQRFRQDDTATHLDDGECYADRRSNVKGSSGDLGKTALVEIQG